MRGIKRKLLAISLSGMLFGSCCFFSSVIEAIGTDPTPREGYFTNDLEVESNEIKGENDMVIPPDPTHGNGQEEGSTITGNEGQVWADKYIEKLDQDGTYKITYYVRGFKYEEVGNDNKRNGIWKNPLEAGSTFTMSEPIDKDFNVSNINIEDAYGIASSDISFNTSEDNSSIILSFNADKVNLINNEGGIAFDVRVSFVMSIDPDVTANIYNTEKANYTFKPAKDNYFYYEWGWQKTNYFMKGLNWNADGTWSGINEISVTLPVSSNPADGTFTLGIGKKGHLEINTNGLGNSFTKTGNELAQIKNSDRELANKIKQNINNIQFNIFRESDGFKFEYIINFTNGTKLVLSPEANVKEGGGNDPEAKIDLGEVITKDDPAIRDEYNPDKNGYLNYELPNYAEIVLVESIVNGQIDVVKTIVGSTDKAGQGDPIFIFKLEGTTFKDSKSVTLYRSVRFSGDETEKIVSFEGLEKGIYTVSEVNRDSMRYKLENANVDENTTTAPYTSDANESGSKTATFYIGYSGVNDSTTNSSNTYGKVEFQNKLELKDNLSDTGIVKNSFTVDENGMITIHKDFLNGKEED